MSVAASRRCAAASVCVFALALAVAGTARGQGIPDSPAPETPAQASDQQATTGQIATTSADAEDAEPTNIFISLRVDSPGDNGPVTQTSTTAVAGDAANDAATAQDAWQHWDSGDQAAEGQPQASAQDSDTNQAAATTATAARAKPTNVVVSVRVNSPGDDGPVTQSSTVVVGAESTNTAATAQKAQQAQTGGQGVAAAPTPAHATPKPAAGAVAERPAVSAPPDAPPTCVSVAPRPAATRIVITIGESCHAHPTKRVAAAPRLHPHPKPAHVAPAAPVVHEVAAVSPPTPTTTAKPRPARPTPHPPVAVKPHDPVAASTTATELVAASVAPSADGARYALLLALLLAMLGAAALWSYGGVHRYRFRRWR
jgi:hypothetical protein